MKRKGSPERPPFLPGGPISLAPRGLGLSWGRGRTAPESCFINCAAPARIPSATPHHPSSPRRRRVPHRASLPRLGPSCPFAPISPSLLGTSSLPGNAGHRREGAEAGH